MLQQFDSVVDVFGVQFCLDLLVFVCIVTERWMELTYCGTLDYVINRYPRNQFSRNQSQFRSDINPTSPPCLIIELT